MQFIQTFLDCCTSVIWSSACIIHLSTGASLAWASPIIPRLNLTSNQNSLLNSLFMLGNAPGQLIVMFGLDALGRKLTLFLVWAAFAISWILLIFSQHLGVIYAARLLGGIGMGGAFSGVPVYVAEISDERLRGPLNSLMQPFLGIGLIVVYAVGPYVSFAGLAWVCFSLAVMFVSLFFFVAPESPHYLLAKGKVKEATNAIRYLKGKELSDEVIQKETSMIQAGLNDTKASMNVPCLKLTSKACLKGMALGIFLTFIQQLSAISSMLAYVEYIFDHTKLNLSSTFVTVLVGLANFVGGVPLPFLVRFLGYKVLFITSSFGCGLSLGGVGIYFYLSERSYDTTNLAWLPVTGIILFNLFYCLALGPLTWSVIAELYSPSVKGLAVGICGVLSAVFGFIIAEIFSLVLDYGFDTTFFGFGALMLISALCCLLFVPDTSKMTLQEIQDYLS